MPVVVMDLKDRRPAWSPPGWVADEIRSSLPPGWELRTMDTEADGSGDGSTVPGPTLLEAVGDAEIYLGYGVTPALLRAAPRLRWAHSGAAGVGSSLSPELKASSVLFTNSKGIHGPPMADTALAMILHFSRGLDYGLAGQIAGRWDTEPYYRKDHTLMELSRAVVGLFGFGGVGRQVARRARALEAGVLAYDRSPEALSGRGRRFDLGSEGLDEDPGVTLLHGEEGLRRLLEESDFLVLTAPETPETRGRFDARAMGRMKKTAVLINLSRGGLVVEEDLARALEAGRLRGAGLDVFETEPLPSGSPLWRLPNVVITPHVSAVTREFWRRQTDLILENLQRYFRGRPLLNQVDLDAGF